jgi:FlaG/FlaF family flagellin (archaellin)
MNSFDEQGQSAVFSTILMVGIVVVMSGIVWAGFVGNGFLGLGAVSASPAVAITLDADQSGLELIHVAGPMLSDSDHVLVVTSAGDSERIDFTALDHVADDGDGRFEAGEQYLYAASLAGTIDVWIVNEETNAVLFRQRVSVGGGDAAPLPGLDFDGATIGSYAPSGSAPQDVDGTVTTDGQSISLSGNTWKTIDYPYTVTSDTVLAFEFKSENEGEIHAIGLMDASQFRENRFFRLFGTQDWGRSTYDTYDLGDGWVRYEIPVGQYYTGDVDSLVIANDHDVPDPTATSSYRNVDVYEG